MKYSSSSESFASVGPPIAAATSLRSDGRSRYYARVFKRPLDICLAFLLLPVCAPLLLITYVLVRLDGGPGFFRQPRIGRNGRVFYCWKLRTMVMDAERVLIELCERDPAVAAEWHANQKLAKDPRITRFGKFLRASSLDELPQIWNVLIGDMSVVGPRPFLVSQETMYRNGGGTAYFHMRPGITGPWQVSGRGETTFVERVRFDHDYWSTISLRRDLSLILKTARVVLTRTGH